MKSLLRHYRKNKISYEVLPFNKVYTKNFIIQFDLWGELIKAVDKNGGEINDINLLLEG